MHQTVTTNVLKWAKTVFQDKENLSLFSRRVGALYRVQCKPNRLCWRRRTHFTGIEDSGLIAEVPPTSRRYHTFDSTSTTLARQQTATSYRIAKGAAAVGPPP